MLWWLLTNHGAMKSENNGWLNDYWLVNGLTKQWLQVSTPENNRHTAAHTEKKLEHSHFLPGCRTACAPQSLVHMKDFKRQGYQLV